MKFSEMPYNRVDFPAVIAQGKEIIQRASQAKSGEEQFEIHQEFYKLLDHVTLSTQLHISAEMGMWQMRFMRKRMLIMMRCFQS